MSSNETITVIENGQVVKNYWQDLWRHRELLFFLAWRDILVRYKQTIIGASWVLIRPLLTMLIFTGLFGSLANLSSNGLPYGLVVFAGMLPWFLFSNVLSEGSNSLVSNSSLLSKVYFPRLVLPLTILVVTLVDFLVSCLLLIAMMFWYKHVPGWQIIFLPLFALLAGLLSLGLGLITASLNVKYRDFRQLIPFLLQLGIYVSPVGYMSSVIPERWRQLYALNPMVGVIDGFRWSLMGNAIAPYWPGVIYSFVVGILFVWLGVRTFRRAEAGFADVI